MANIGDGGGGRTGPYWRRKLGMTHPGEFTGAQLQRINMLRQALGQAPVGGRVGFDTPQGPQAPEDVGGGAQLGQRPGPADHLAGGAGGPQQWMELLKAKLQPG